MAAGLGFKTFTTGEVLTAADTNGYLMQGVLVFASSAARASAITSPQEGQYSYLKDTNSTEYYDGAAWIAAPTGDVTGVTAGTGILVASPTGPVPTVSIDTAVTADLTTAQTMTNKTLTTPVIASISNGGTVTIPSGADTLVARTSTDTLTNKTLTTPKISNYTTNGDLVYGTGSSVITRLGIGSTSQVLTVTGGVPVWATPSGGTSGLNLISTTTWSATASQSFNSVFTTTYTNYRLIININDPTVDSTIRIRLRVSGTDNSGANYMTVMNGIASNGTPASFVSSADTSFLLSETDAGTAGNRYGYSIDLFKPQTNTLKTAQVVDMGMNNAGLPYTVFGGLMFTTAIQADGFTLYPASGNFSGTCSIYGYGI